MNRRELLLGATASAVALSLPVVPAIAIEVDPLVRGIRWQAWPIGTERPAHLCEQGMVITSGIRKPVSYFLKKFRFTSDEAFYYEAIQ